MFVVCAQPLHRPCQSMVYECVYVCVYVYEGAGQDGYSAWPVRSLLSGFIGRSAWWRL